MKYFSKKGFDSYNAHIQNLEKKVKSHASKSNQFFEDGGGWHDNFGFEEHQRQMIVNSKILKEAKLNLRDARIVDYPKNPEKVQIGTRVKALIDGVKETYEIVGYGENDFEKNRILYDTPLAQAFMLKEPGDKYETFVVGKKHKIEIIGLEGLD